MTFSSDTSAINTTDIKPDITVCMPILGKMEVEFYVLSNGTAVLYEGDLFIDF